MDQDATWYEGSSHIVLNGNPGLHPMHTFQVVCKHNICEVRLVSPLSDNATVMSDVVAVDRADVIEATASTVWSRRQSGDYVAGFCVGSTCFYAVGLQLGI